MQRSKFHFVTSTNKAPQSSTQAEMQALSSLVHTKGSPTLDPSALAARQHFALPCPAFPQGKQALTCPPRRGSAMPHMGFFVFYEAQHNGSLILKKTQSLHKQHIIWLNFIAVCNVWLFIIDKLLRKLAPRLSTLLWQTCHKKANKTDLWSWNLLYWNKYFKGMIYLQSVI